MKALSASTQTLLYKNDRKYNVAHIPQVHVQYLYNVIKILLGNLKQKENLSYQVYFCIH